MASPARPPTVLIVLHQEHSTPGRVGMALRALGARLDIRRTGLGEPLPNTLAEHDGVIVFGGPMGANDAHEWIQREIEWLAVPLAEDKPFLGICLGAQMLTRALGARVFSYEDKRSEIGYFPICPNAAADALCAAPFPRSVYQWHSDGFDLPAGAELLGHRRQRFPQPGLSPRQGGGAAVPPRGDLPHDVPVDLARGRAADPPRRARPARPSRGLVPARRPGGGLARGLPAAPGSRAGSARRRRGGRRRPASGRASPSRSTRQSPGPAASPPNSGLRSRLLPPAMEEARSRG